MTDIRVPKFNSNDSSYVLIEWLVEDGQRARTGDLIAVLETSKATEELVAEEDGFVWQAVPVNADCPPGTVIARLTRENTRPSPASNAPADGSGLAVNPRGGGPDAVGLAAGPRDGGPDALGLAAGPRDGRPDALGLAAAVRPEAGVVAASEAGSGPVRGDQSAHRPLVTGPAQELIDELDIDPEEVRRLGVSVVRRADIERLVADRPAHPGPASVPRSGSTPGPVSGGPPGSAPGHASGGPPGSAPGHASGGPPGSAPGHASDMPPGPAADHASDMPPHGASAHAPGGPSGPSSGDGSGSAPGGVPYLLSRVQRAVARAVRTSHETVPAAYAVVRVDVGAALELSARLTKEVRRPVGLPELVTCAVARLHATFPLFFATLVDDGHAMPAEVPNVGVTFDAGEGLYVPVVHDAARRPVREVAHLLMKYRLAALTGDFRESDLAGADIVVTLHHDGDVTLAIPLIFPGNACALAVTAPQDELRLEAGAVVSRTVANIGLAYDHRLINGRDAALFLRALKELLEAPEKAVS
ncbi:2-oxo acid dehydrogenase subunit E2 [Microtetraspora fusca]|uniref:2-oxo acid dehydrogenase subunit E2 n=1 Tax=Microtetraspora fusca TaxID=1997 RepID=UPI00082DA1D3|nr:2-oxo acid dehydrogenase subunit E2 [Microtetraspora fusca]